MATIVNARYVGSAYQLNTPDDPEFKYYEKLMRNKPDGSRDCAAASCRECPYFHPDWEYRFCYFSKCKYGKDINVFKVNHKKK